MSRQRPVALIDRIASEISERGPMFFDRFMEMALYDLEAGFFGAGRLRSHRTGDFLTSPEVSPLFGEALARFVVAEADRRGDLDVVIDCGAGSGSLLAAALPHLGDIGAVAVEVSPAARQALAARLPAIRVVGSLDEVGGRVRGVIVANELLDNLPAAVAVRSVDGWLEEAVIVADASLRATTVPARPEVMEWAVRHAAALPPGSRVEVQLAAGKWLRTAIGMLDAGAVVVIDYGDTTAGLADRRAEGTMRTYRAHHLGPDPLLEPGATDITMDVDFSALMAVAESSRAATEYTTQAEFLTTWGLRQQLSTLRHEELAAARTGSTMERLQLRSRVTEAETLLHPRGLGDFRVLVARKSHQSPVSSPQQER
ncbi:MAG: SAM-dependent methyltransferase [Acidimicrobiia bacterium]|nr:SAM-dependent methyltransferase [Acidimicrobiia bacterium]